MLHPQNSLAIGEIEFWCTKNIESNIVFELYAELFLNQITSPGWMHETGVRAWCTGKTQRDQVEREVGGEIGMGNTCVMSMYDKNHYNIVK